MRSRSIRPDSTCLDVGASTGGFTDVLLQRGARRVYAVDVGRGQLADALRRDPRVVSFERTNARTLGPGVLAGAGRRWPSSTSRSSRSASSSGRSPPASGRPAAPSYRSSSPSSKPGAERWTAGVVRDPAVHLEVLRRVVARARELGLAAGDVIASPILGPEGNREFLLRLAVGRVRPDGVREIEPALDGLTDERLVEVTGG